MKTIVEWLRHKWVGVDPTLLKSYHSTFIGNPQGAQVLQHLLDSVYCTVYEGTDPNAALAHNARRSVVHEILVNLDVAEHPEKWAPKVETTAEEILNG